MQYFHLDIIPLYHQSYMATNPDQELCDGYSSIGQLHAETLQSCLVQFSCLLHPPSWRVPQAYPFHICEDIKLILFHAIDNMVQAWVSVSCQVTKRMVSGLAHIIGAACAIHYGLVDIPDLDAKPAYDLMWPGYRTLWLHISISSPNHHSILQFHHRLIIL